MIFILRRPFITYGTSYSTSRARRGKLQTAYSAVKKLTGLSDRSLSKSRLGSKIASQSGCSNWNRYRSRTTEDIV